MDTKTIKYFIYDSINQINTNQISIKQFSYDSNTLVLDFYKELIKEYHDIYKDTNDNLYFVSFIIQNPPLCPEISDRTIDLYIDDIIENPNIIICLTPVLPIGGTFASYKNNKIIMHSNEGNHLHFPHVHYIQHGLESVISLETFEIVEGVDIPKKDYKKIVEYLMKNKKYLIETYYMIVNGQAIGKIAMDVIQ